MPRRKQAASPADIQHNGAVAAAIKRGLAAKDMTVTDLARQLELKTPSSAYGWVSGKWGVSAQYRAKVAELLGIDKEELIRRKDASAPDSGVRPEKLSKFIPRVVRMANIMYSFTVTPDGQVQLTMSVENFQHFVQFLTGKGTRT